MQKCVFLHAMFKNVDVNIGNWEDGPEGKRARTLEYIVPLSNPLGPKQTRTFIVETIHHHDLRK